MRSNYFYLQGINLLSVAIHEIGHAIGIPHSNNPNSVMHPIFNTENPRIALHADDIDTAQKLMALK